MERRISVIIPNYNKGHIIGECLAAVFSSEYNNFEVIVVDDNSSDQSLEEIRKYPCRLIELDRRVGTSRARNMGAQNSSGEILFFTDADCIVQGDTLDMINRSVSQWGEGVIIGGTYTLIPFDTGFFSAFQSVFIHYSELKHSGNPDYIAAHAMVMDVGTFHKSGGFPEIFLPIIEDVELSHRLKRDGHCLVMDGRIQVRHVFCFSFLTSLRNAFRKSTYWTIYSLSNKDVMSDSGTASVELKTNVAAHFLSTVSVALSLLLSEAAVLAVVPSLLVLNLFVSRKLLVMFRKARGTLFAAGASLYYMALYPVPVGMGAVTGIMIYLFRRKTLQSRQVIRT